MFAELTGQRNAIDGRVVEVVAEMKRDELCGSTGSRSVAAVVAWKTGVAPRTADTGVAVARRLTEFPRLAAGLREGRLSRTGHTRRLCPFHHRLHHRGQITITGPPSASSSPTPTAHP